MHSSMQACLWGKSNRLQQEERLREGMRGRLLGLGSGSGRMGSQGVKGGRELSDLNKVNKLERLHFVDLRHGLCKCVPMLVGGKTDVLVQVS